MAAQPNLATNPTPAPENEPSPQFLGTPAGVPVDLRNNLVILQGGANETDIRKERAQVGDTLEADLDRILGKTDVTDVPPEVDNLNDDVLGTLVDAPIGNIHGIAEKWAKKTVDPAIEEAVEKKLSRANFIQHLKNALHQLTEELIAHKMLVRIPGARPIAGENWTAEQAETFLEAYSEIRDKKITEWAMIARRGAGISGEAAPVSKPKEEALPKKMNVLVSEKTSGRWSDRLIEEETPKKEQPKGRRLNEPAIPPAVKGPKFIGPKEMADLQEIYRETTVTSNDHNINNNPRPQAPRVLEEMKIAERRGTKKKNRR